MTNADAGASGTMQLTMTVTRDSAQNITGATYDFIVNITGFPANTTLTGAHIHNAPAGTNTGGRRRPAADRDRYRRGDRAGDRSPRPRCRARRAPLTAAQVAQGVFNNPAGNYFNVHTSVNSGGAIRGQLVKQN